MEGTQMEFASLGFNGLLSIAVTLLSIYLAWVVLQELKPEAFLKRPNSPRAKMLLVMLAIILGHAFATFILDYLNWSQMLRYLVE
ncbi:membrane protein [Paenibacillus darwinianus]|uniref:Membrane protein n=2 Tax=Paenibacillus darwinianus TaxID=1380763 RepID=A0A9W5W6R0_9BACL|nr:membrane protein [Paenibacillus darwinianus]EXX85642.1 membrane protein [Paenibacillus darwinianus]EXX88858.1 membrane protein [Paenibacillus darwinianus]